MRLLTSEIKLSFNSALKKLTSYSRRAYAAELCADYFDHSARKMERAFKFLPKVKQNVLF